MEDKAIDRSVASELFGAMGKEDCKQPPRKQICNDQESVKTWALVATAR